MSHDRLGFARTSCGCHQCQEACKIVPGMLIPEDIEPLSIFCGFANPLDFAKQHLLASPGGQYKNTTTGQIFRIPTLVPARNESGHCIWLTDDCKCQVHEAAPFGCACFSMCDSQSEEDAYVRRITAANRIARAWNGGEPYANVHQILWAMQRRAIAPEMCRQPAKG